MNYKLQNFRNLFPGYTPHKSNPHDQDRLKQKTEKRVFCPQGNMDTWIMLFSRQHQQDCAITYRKVTITVLRPWKKVVFAAKHNAAQVREKLEDVYPKLKNGGGFEILRSCMA